MRRKNRSYLIHQPTDDLRTATDKTTEYILYYEISCSQQTGLHIRQLAEVEFRMRNIPTQIQRLRQLRDGVPIMPKADPSDKSGLADPLNSSLHFYETRKPSELSKTF